MKPRKFSKKEAIRFGWQTMKSNFWFFVLLLIVATLIPYVPDIIKHLVRAEALVFVIIVSLVSWALSAVIQVGLIRIALKFCDNQKGKYSDLFAYYPLFFKYLLGSILYGLIVLAGTILLIIPGIIWAIKYQFFSYFIVDKGAGPIEALKRSSAITKGSKWNLFLFALLLGLINLLGMLCLLLGSFATMPTTMVASAFVYRKLLSQTEIAQIPELPQVG